MRYLPTSKLTPGMALGQDIYDGAGRLLLAKHLLLSEEYISNLEFLGFPGIYIDDEFTQGIEIQQVLNPQVRSQALKVVHDMFAFDAASDAEEDMPVSEIKIQKTIERIVENILSNGDIMCNVCAHRNGQAHLDCGHAPTSSPLFSASVPSAFSIGLRRASSRIRMHPMEGSKKLPDPKNTRHANGAARPIRAL